MHAAPAWLIVNVWPAIVIVPLRPAVAVFAATLYATVPLPLPLLPLVIEIHEALLAAVHPQPVPAETATLPVVLDCEIERLAGEIVGAHVAEYPKVFDAALALAPPGPIAVTRPS